VQRQHARLWISRSRFEPWGANSNVGAGHIRPFDRSSESPFALGAGGSERRVGILQDDGLTEAIAASLRARQRPDGGWPARTDGPSDTESTAWAVLALGREAYPSAPDGRSALAGERAASGGLRWLLESQESDGGWAWSPAAPGAGWATAPAMLALVAGRGADDAVARGGRWLLRTRGRGYSLRTRFLLWLLNRKPAVALDASLRGWPWVPDTFGWVEPTAWSLLALRACAELLPPARVRDRTDDGEAMLLDRACVGGGWNYGNRTVLGVDLWPYPDTTAIALLALERRADAPPVREGLEALTRLLSPPASRLSLALSALAFAVHGRDATGVLDRLRIRWTDATDETTTRATAISLLALRGGRLPGAGGGSSS
jgi:hypothetical protein